MGATTFDAAIDSDVWCERSVSYDFVSAVCRLSDQQIFLQWPP